MSGAVLGSCRRANRLVRARSLALITPPRLISGELVNEPPSPHPAPSPKPPLFPANFSPVALQEQGGVNWGSFVSGALISAALGSAPSPPSPRHHLGVISGNFGVLVFFLSFFFLSLSLCPHWGSMEVRRRGGGGGGRGRGPPAFTKIVTFEPKKGFGSVPDLSSGLGGMPRSPVRSLRVRSSICSCTGRNQVRKKK